MGNFYNWNNVFDLFEALNEAGVKYVVLRNFENMHNKDFFCNGHEDIDILCENPEVFAQIAKAIPKMWPEDIIHYMVFIDKIGVPVDVRSLGDSYYDNLWEKQMLEKRMIADNGNWYVLTKEDYYYSLVYHSILQKDLIFKDYVEKLNNMGKDLGLEAVNVKDHLKHLDVYMKMKKYQYVKPIDPSVPFQEKYILYSKACLNMLRKVVGIKSILRFVHDRCYSFFKETFLCEPLRNIKRKLKYGRFDEKTGRFLDVEKISSKIRRRYGEDVYAQLAQRKVYQYMSKYDIEVEQMFYEGKRRAKEMHSSLYKNMVFTMWWQGWEKMPILVKNCVASLEKLNKKVVVLTKENIKDFIYLPDYIWKKYYNGQIGKAHFSDIVRMAILAKYGGVWVDATCYIAREVPSCMTDDFFVFKQSPQLRECRQYGNWWIAAPAGHEIILKQLCSLLCYWKHESVAYDYYIFHVIWRKIIDSNISYKKMVDDIPDYYTDSTHLLLNRYDKNFDSNEWKIMKEISPVFKCSYKCKGLSSLDTYYIKLCNGELE